MDVHPSTEPSQLRAFLTASQEERLRSRFDLTHAPLQLITSGWHRLVVAAPDRVFVFPRHSGEVPGVEREAQVLAQTQLGIAPRLLGVHRGQGISPYPFLELSRIHGQPYDAIVQQMTTEDAATALEDLGRRVAQWHCTPVPESLATAPSHRETPRVSGRWIEPTSVEDTVAWAADLVAAHVYPEKVPHNAWLDVLHEIAAMVPVTVHGELSEGQFLLDHQHRVTGVVDWDALHIGHPLLDFNFGVGGVGVHLDNRHLRSRMWNGYVAARGREVPALPVVETLWALLDATTLITADVNDPRLSKALAQLTDR